MTTAGMSNLFIRDIFDRIKSESTLYDFFSAVLSCPIHSTIRDLQNELANVIPQVLDPLKEDNAMALWCLRAVVTISKVKALEGLVSEMGPLLLNAISDKKWAMDWAVTHGMKVLKDELASLVKRSNGLHSNASRTTKASIYQFSITDLAQRYQNLAPHLWSVVQSLGDARNCKSSSHKRKSRKKIPSTSVKGKIVGIIKDVDATVDDPQQHMNGSVESDSSDGSDEYAMSDDLDDSPLQVLPGPTAVGKRRRRIQDPVDLFNTKKNIKSVAIISILAQSSNQLANTFQVALGMHLKSNHASEKLVTVLSHTGVSVSGPTIELMINSLHKDAMNDIKSLCTTNTASLVYDNLNFAQRKPEATLTSDTTFASMTAATFLPLHGAQPDQLKVVKELWRNDPLNPHRDPQSTWEHPSYLLLSTKRLPDGRSIHSAVRDDLIFQIARMLVETEPALGALATELTESFVPMRQVPLQKTTPLPAETMDYDEGTLDGNESVLADLRRQGGYNTSQDEYIQITHCDMATYMAIKGVISHRRREKTPLGTRYVYILPVPGIFHTHMAMGDAFNRIHGPNSDDVEYDGSFMSLSAKARPRQIKKLRHKPPYRLLQHLIFMVTTSSIKDCWNREYEGGIKALIAAKPTLSDIMAKAAEIHDKYVAIDNTGRVPPIQANQKLLHRDGLLYVAAHYALKRGDIGRFENQLILWLPIFRAVDKHGYANNMLEFLTDLRHNWPEDLANIIRDNWLVNITGGPTDFMGVDMLQEIHNGQQKNAWSGDGSNRNKAMLRKYSPLIRFFRDMRQIFDSNFNNKKTGTQHKSADVSTVISTLQDHISRLKLNDMSIPWVPHADDQVVEEKIGMKRKRNHAHGRRMDALEVGYGLLYRNTIPKNINGFSRPGTHVNLPKANSANQAVDATQIQID